MPVRVKIEVSWQQLNYTTQNLAENALSGKIFEIFQDFWPIVPKMSL